MKHTPGPWEVVEVPVFQIGNTWYEYYIQPTVCKMAACTERDAANARLIAAAPDLLRLLRALIDDDNTYNILTYYIDPAILRAAADLLRRLED